MPKFEKHIFICVNERTPEDPRGCCKERGSEKIRELFKEEVARRGLKGKVRANAAGCLDHCEHGPTVVIYPDGVWYKVQTPEDVKEIMDEHIEGNRIVTRLAIYSHKS
jgi:(2Fe-2S) ferredoxin